ncbi:MAG: hypothetical protein O2800_03575 [Planctomycetota bacterium]|nr:hypothetical protein [Planctomycetota bacterium]
MVRKLVVLVVGLAAIAMALLALRQREAEISREAARAHWRIREQERSMAQLELRLNQAVAPSQLRDRVERMPGEFVSVPVMPRDLRPSATRARAVEGTPAPKEVWGG